MWVQFYNNPHCELGSAGFSASVQNWSSALQESTLPTKPKLYIGAPAWALAGSTAYSGMGRAEGIKKVVEEVKGMNGVGNLGGVMFWE